MIFQYLFLSATIVDGKSYATKENEPEEFLSTEALVYKKIMAGYDSDVRPGKTEYDGGPIEMTLDLYLMSLLGISEKQEQMITSGYTTQVSIKRLVLQDLHF